MDVRVRAEIPFDAGGRNATLGNRKFGHTSARDIDLGYGSRHVINNKTPAQARSSYGGL